MPSESGQFLRPWTAAMLAIGSATLISVVLIAAIRLFGNFGLMVAVGIPVFLVMLAVHPLVPFTLYFGALFFAETTLPGVPVNANQVFAVLFFLSFGSYWLRGQCLPLRFKLLPYLSLVAVYFTVNALLGQDFERGSVHARYVVIYYVMAVCLASCLRSEKSLLALAWVVVLTSAAAGAIGLVEAVEKNLLAGITGRLSAGGRLKGTAPNSIVYGWHMVYAMPFAFFLFSELKTSAARIAALLLGLLPISAATLTFNRQTYIVIALVLGLGAVLFRYSNRKTLITLLASLGVLASVTVLPLVLTRLLSVANLARDYSFLERRDSFLIGMEMLKTNAVFGIGLGSFPAVWKEYVPLEYTTFFVQYMEGSTLKFPDFAYLAVLVETGIVGLALFLVLLARIFWMAWQIRKSGLARSDRFAANLGSLIITLLAFVVATSAIQDTFLYPKVWLLFGLALLLDPKVIGVTTPLVTEGTKRAEGVARDGGEFLA